MDSVDKSTYHNPAVSTALIPYVGYHKATVLAKHMKQTNLSVFEANDELKLIGSERLIELMKPESLIRQGYSLNDIIKY